MKARIALILASTLAVGSAVAAEEQKSLSVSHGAQYQVYGGDTGTQSFSPEGLDVRVTFHDDWVFGVERASQSINGSGLGFSVKHTATRFIVGYRADTDLYSGDFLTVQAAVTVGGQYTIYKSALKANNGLAFNDKVTEFDFHYDPHLTARLALTDALSVDANIHAYYDLDLKQVVSKQSLGLTYKF